MKILITGHRGFIGKNLRYNLMHTHEVDTYDIADNTSCILSQDFSQYDWVIHVGAYSSTTETDVKKVLDNNLTWSIQLFEQCIKYNVNFQWSSSASVYGSRCITQGKFVETDELYPCNVYAMSKYLLEQYITKRNPHNITYQGFRYFNVYGYGEEHKKNQASLYHQFFMQATKDKTINIFTGSDQIYRDFVPIEKVVQTHERMLSQQVNGIWNVGTGIPKSFLQVAKEVATNFEGIEIKEIPFPEHLKSHYQYYTCADTTKLDKELKTSEFKTRSRTSTQTS